MIIGEVIQQITRLFADAGLQSPRLDAELIVAHCLGIEPGVLALKSRETPSEAQMCEVGKLAGRRANREPIQYILGHREFWSIDLLVREGVLIPRPETETLVEVAIELMSARARPDSVTSSPLVLDIGTGSGAIAIAIAKELGKRCRVVATDISSSALIVARMNVQRWGLADVVKLVQCDMAEALSAQAKTNSLARRVDLIVCNPPYIPTRLLKELQPEISRFEPLIALDGGASGLDFYPRLMEAASALLTTGAALLCEIAPDMPADIRNIWLTYRRFLSEPRFVPDLAHRPRAAVLRRLP